ncbi:hypothetical protein [Petrachloros mirabilis]
MKKRRQWIPGLLLLVSLLPGVALCSNTGASDCNCDLNRRLLEDHALDNATQIGEFMSLHNMLSDSTNREAIRYVDVVLEADADVGRNLLVYLTVSRRDAPPGLTFQMSQVGREMHRVVQKGGLGCRRPAHFLPKTLRSRLGKYGMLLFTSVCIYQRSQDEHRNTYDVPPRKHKRLD